MVPNKYKIKISEKRGPFTSVRWDFRGPLKKDEISMHFHKLKHKHPRVEKVRLPHEGNWAREMQIQLTKRSHGSPSLNMMKVGKASIRYLSAMLGYFSVSIFTTWILSFSWEATSLRTGAMNWQGPHLETRAWITHFQFNHILLINICYSLEVTQNNEFWLRASPNSVAYREKNYYLRQESWFTHKTTIVLQS